MRIRALTTQTEAVVSDQLHRGLDRSDWRVAPHVAVREVVRVEDEALTQSEIGILNFGHFDFAIYPSRLFDQKPAFVVEFDGPTHETDLQAARDIAKNALCARAGLPLLRLTFDDLTPLERRTMVAWIAERFAAHEREMPELVRRTRHELEDLAEDGADMDMVVESCDYDTGVIFDLDHPFPENVVIARRLLDRFGIGTRFVVEGLAAPLQLEVDSWISLTEDGRVSESVVAERRCSVRRGAEVLHQFRAKARMAWAHKVRNTGPAGGIQPSGYGYDMWSGESMRWVLQRLEDLNCRYVPGADPHDITEAISLYNAMRQTERWAVANL